MLCVGVCFHFKKCLKKGISLLLGEYSAASAYFSSLYVKFSFVRFPGTITVALTSVMGHESLITTAIPLAFEVQELKKILCGEFFWQSCSASFEVLVSSSKNMLEWDLFILL